MTLNKLDSPVLFPILKLSIELKVNWYCNVVVENDILRETGLC